MDFSDFKAGFMDFRPKFWDFKSDFKVRPDSRNFTSDFRDF